MKKTNTPPHTGGSGLWSRDFTIITLGSVVSMVGGTLSGFALSIMVLDYTGSTLLYILTNVGYQLPMLICPLIAGPYLDRMSRKKAIYRLDFLSAGIALVMFLLLRFGWYSYPVLLGYTVLSGAIESVYSVAYDSLYPNLIPEGHLSQGYSVSSLLWPLAAMTSPIAAVIYTALGTVAPLFAFNAVCLLVAACFERTIGYQETRMAQTPQRAEGSPLSRFRREFRSGLDYLARERGLLVITVYFALSNFTGNAAEGLWLPFFRNNAGLFSAWPVAAVTLYAIVSNFSVAGRFAGGLLHYRLRLPARRKFAIALTVYFVIAVLDGVTLFLPVPLMAAANFLYGALGVTSYNIRTAATQSYVPDTVRARFNSVFTMICSMGGILGSLAAGGLAELLPERTVVLIFGLVELAAVVCVMVPGRKEVAGIYNREV
ncbi:MAG: MFS transporter [Clostridiales bacterium]|nr:MFS transporter [Clostridiales bacterium]